MDDDDPPAPSRPSRIGLVVASVAFTLVALVGPVLLALEIDPSTWVMVIPLLWLTVFAGIGHYARGFFRFFR
jgi:hypothetical protein